MALFARIDVDIRLEHFHIMTCLSTASSQKLIHEGVFYPPPNCVHPIGISSLRRGALSWLAGTLKTNEKVKEGAVSRSQLLTGPLAFRNFCRV